MNLERLLKTEQDSKFADLLLSLQRRHSNRRNKDKYLESFFAYSGHSNHQRCYVPDQYDIPTISYQLLGKLLDETRHHLVSNIFSYPIRLQVPGCLSMLHLNYMSSFFLLQKRLVSAPASI